MNRGGLMQNRHRRCGWMGILILSMLLFSGCTPQVPLHPARLNYPPLVFNIPDVERFNLANGIRVYLREDSELPLVQVTAMVGSGALAAPRELTGFDDLFAAALRTGGTETLPAATLEERLDRLAADLSCDMGPYATQLGLSVRRSDLGEGLGIVAGLLRHPAFAEDRLELARSRAQERLRRSNDEPEAMAARLLLRALYPGHPLGDYPTQGSLAAIRRSDLLAFHKNNYVPGNLWLAISGDVSRNELVPVLERLFGDWKKDESAELPLPALNAPSGGLLQVVTKEIPQTTIMLGGLGLTKDNPDQYPARVLNFILGGGGFNSRLMREIRSDRGLAYSVWSQFQVGRRFPGPVMVGTETKNASVGEVLLLIRKIMNDLRDQPVSDEELRVAKESLVNSFIFGFDNPHTVVVQRMQLDFYAYPADYLARFREQIAAVTADDVQRVARIYLHPEQQQIVIVGRPDETGRSLEDFKLPVVRKKAEEIP